MSTQASALAEVQGHGSAKEGAHHWGLERATSVASLVLLIWLLVSLWRLPALDYLSVSQWLKDPFAATPMLLFIVATFWHLKMGLIVVIEDYVHEPVSKLLWVLLINFAAIFAGSLAVFALLKIAFAAAATGAIGG
jgi:succinate dehydrogenase / fumarate reductase membrane anchor subunit